MGQARGIQMDFLCKAHERGASLGFTRVNADRVGDDCRTENDGSSECERASKQNNVFHRAASSK